MHEIIYIFMNITKTFGIKNIQKIKIIFQKFNILNNLSLSLRTTTITKVYLFINSIVINRDFMSFPQSLIY